MKKIVLFITIFLYNTSEAQHVLTQVAKYYFRINPFNQRIGQFLQQLINDPTLINQSILKRTDTSLFYLRGEYKHYNPFFFKATRTQVVLAESEVVLNDSLHITDRIMTYQVAGYTEGGKDGLNDVKQEFGRFDRKYLKKFVHNELTNLKSGDAVYGGIRDYYFDFSYLSPLSVGWQKIGTSHENVFVITLRFKISDDVAVLPVSPDSP
jgi:hypothetical protein